MKETTLQGKIAFINHDKKYAIIEYDNNGKKKTVNGSIDGKVQKKWKEDGLIKKVHHFLLGDIVSFKNGISDRGDRMIATNIEFLYNNALDVLVNKAKTENRFLGYLKIVDDKYFVKEIDSYLFFPVPFSPWQILPTEEELNEQVIFSLENTEKKEKIFASLLTNVYIPEFHTAVKLYKSKTAVEAEVYNVTPHGIYLNVVEDKIKAKLQLDLLPEGTEIKAGDKIPVIITHLSKSRIAVIPADQ